MPDRHLKSLLPFARFGPRKKPEQMGSGVLVALFGKHFILSATHVLDEPSLAVPGLPLSESGRIFLSKPNDGSVIDDHLDIGYVLLTDDAVKILQSRGYEFLQASAVSIELGMLHHVVCVFSGFPASKSATRMKPVTISSTPFLIRGEVLSQPALFRLNRDPQLHVGIPYRRELMREEGSERDVVGPLPQGMSGGAVWLILPDGRPVFIAIGTDYTGDALIGTLVQPLIRLLKGRYGQPAH